MLGRHVGERMPIEAIGFKMTTSAIVRMRARARVPPRGRRGKTERAEGGLQRAALSANRARMQFPLLAPKQSTFLDRLY